MAIQVADGFYITTNIPSDARSVVTDLTELNAMPTLVRFLGLKTWVISEGIYYYLPDDINTWEPFEAGGGGGGGSRLNLMEDGSFEGDAPFGFEMSGAGSITVETSDVMVTPSNVQAMKVALSADNQIHQLWEIPPAMNGVKGRLEFWAKTNKEIVVSVWSNGSLVGTDLVEISSTYKKFSLPFIFNSDNVEVFIDNDEAATYLFDEMFIGPSTNAEFTDDQLAAMPNGIVEAGVVSDYTLDANAPDFITVDTSGNNVTIDLPAPSNFKRTITIIKIIDNNNTLIINGNGALVNGSATKEIWDINNSVTLRSDGTNWWIT